MNLMVPDQDMSERVYCGSAFAAETPVSGPAFSALEGL
jgi:hypothetical protein